MKGGKIIQKPIRKAGEQVVVETELGCPSGKMGGQRGGVKKPAAAVHLTAMTGAKVGAC